MRRIDFTALRETALILTFSPREKESSLPLGETRAQAAVRAIGGV